MLLGTRSDLAVATYIGRNAGFFNSFNAEWEPGVNVRGVGATITGGNARKSSLELPFFRTRTALSCHDIEVD